MPLAPILKKSTTDTPTMIVDRSDCFQRNPEILQDVCNHRVEMANFILSCGRGFHDQEDISFYESEIRHYKHYDV